MEECYNVLWSSLHYFIQISVLKILRYNYNSLNYQQFCGTWRATAVSVRTTSCQLWVWCPLDWLACKTSSLDSDKDCCNIIRCLLNYFQHRMWTEIILQRVSPDTQYFSCVILHVQVWFTITVLDGHYLGNLRLTLWSRKPRIRP
jgi:hypothetical protein